MVQFSNFLFELFLHEINQSMNILQPHIKKVVFEILMSEKMEPAQAHFDLKSDKKIATTFLGGCSRIPPKDKHSDPR